MGKSLLWHISYSNYFVRCQSRDFPLSYAAIPSFISCFTTVYCMDPYIFKLTTWQGSLNIPKCKYLSLSSSDGSPSGGSYTGGDSDDIEIHECSEEQDLGITFSSNLKFSKHINLSIMKANRMVGIIKCTFLHLTPTAFCILYISLVRPHLDYASITWNPYLLKDIRALEAVQRRATKMVPDLSRLTHEERLQVLSLPSLYYRRKRMDMTTAYKIIRGLVEVPHQDLFTISCNTTRSNGLKLDKERANINTRLNFSLTE